MTELVFVILVFGIIAAVALPRVERDQGQEAADNILSAIRYTQHLALTDNRHDFTSEDWQKSFWTIRFDDVDTSSDKSYAYKIASNRDYNSNIDRNESARDPINGKYLYASSTTLEADESPNVLLGEKYGINSLDFTRCKTTANGDNTSQHIAFDHLGRPHKGVYNVAKNDYRTLITGSCVISFGFKDTSLSEIKIIIVPETGYAYIDDQEDS